MDNNEDLDYINELINDIASIIEINNGNLPFCRLKQIINKYDNSITEDDYINGTIFEKPIFEFLKRYFIDHNIIVTGQDSFFYTNETKDFYVQTRKTCFSYNDLKISPCTQDENRELCKIIYSPATTPAQKEMARKRMIEGNIPLIYRIFPPSSKNSIELTGSTNIDDFIQTCIMGLIDAVDSYDYIKSAFSYYAKKCIFNRLKREKVRVQAKKRSSISPTESFESLNIGEVINDPALQISDGVYPEEMYISYKPLSSSGADSINPYEYVESQELQDALRRDLIIALSSLPDKKLKIISSLFDNAKTKSLSEIGREFNCSKQNVHSLYKAALEKLNNSPALRPYRSSSGSTRFFSSSPLISFYDEVQQFKQELAERDEIVTNLPISHSLLE